MMQAYHRHMQELFAEHTAFELTLLSASKSGRHRSRDDGPSVRYSST
jgi:hypothetical protein